MLEHFGSRQLHEGVAESLARLKKAAERSQPAGGKWVRFNHRGWRRTARLMQCMWYPGL